MVSVSLICSFQRMRNHLGLKEVGSENVLKESAAAVVEVIHHSSSTLCLSEESISIDMCFLSHDMHSNCSNEDIVMVVWMNVSSHIQVQLWWDFDKF